MTQTPKPSDNKIRVPLSRAIPAHGEQISELVFREPSGLDIARCGNPVKLNFAYDPPEVTFDEPKMARMMSMLGDVPASTIEKLTGSDWNACAWMLSGFFIPGAPTRSGGAAD
ncbi:phage tail assembly protein [Kaistia dalseonensis]|uniref:Phage tail assembly protein n=1 Tax=Kaistia dalseonensis TaxID=410840 RepID=A0ABU0H9Q4_9HYPH|nr:phage tail assembly protein [Kaistia dalseonensis]MCX5496434.1 phage tail assembly protein [Kaistia dalseonensis]MDQ0439054.1 hypothetical protein [Kaistia dalseonensis]